MSALKPVVGAQGTPPSPQLNKPMHPQSSPTTYTQPTTHMPQSLINLPHTNPNPAHQPNHYPNANQHYTSSAPIPPSNHPVASGGQNYTANKNQQQFAAGYQPNIVQNAPANQGNNPVPPVSQALRATVENATEKPQSNGTPEAKTPEKVEETPPPQENHVTAESEVKKAPEPAPAVVEAPAAKPEPPSESEKKEESKEVTEVQNEQQEASTEESAESREASATPPKAKEPEKEKKASTPVKASPRTPRKSKTPKGEVESPKKVEPKTPPPPKPSTSAGKSKRNRMRTQHYQSPLPEIEIITKISSAVPRNKNSDDKLIVFYKNEFLAVRNSEGGFYVCQAVQNIYKTSPKIRIRWLSQEKNEKNGEIYTPDFYDHTDFDCILTNLKLERVDKGRFRLPPQEKVRTDSILKRSLAVEKGEVTSPSLTEEHPDGIDVSLYKEESQLKKRRGRKRRASSTTPVRAAKKTENAKVRKVEAKAKPDPKKRGAAAEPTPSTSRSDRAKRRDNQTEVSPVVDAKKAKVLAKVVRKTTKIVKATPSTSKKAAPKAVAATRKTKRTRK